MSQPDADWNDRDKVEWYLGQRGVQRPREQGEQLLVDLLPSEPASLLDLGCGDGRLAELVRVNRPTICTVVGVDLSQPMLERAAERIGGADGVRLVLHDLHEPVTDLGHFDVIVSGAAIHHLPDRRKWTLYGEVAGMLNPGGVFLNLDIVQSPTPVLHAEFLAAIGREADDPEDKLTPVGDQLTWLRAAGLDDVDCVWRWRGFALLLGRKAPA